MATEEVDRLLLPPRRGCLDAEMRPRSRPRTRSVVSPEPLPTGKVRISIDFVAEGKEGYTVAGAEQCTRLRLSVNGTPVGEVTE